MGIAGFKRILLSISEWIGLAIISQMAPLSDGKPQCNNLTTKVLSRFSLILHLIFIAAVGRPLTVSALQ
jgi:hypothetical protein